MTWMPQDRENVTGKLNITALHGVYLTVKNARRSADWFAKHFRMAEAEYGPYSSVRLSAGASVVLVEATRRNV
jgi:hypothetical protein